MLSYILTIDEDYYRKRDGRSKPIERQAVLDDWNAVMDSFKKDLDAWLKKNNHEVVITKTHSVFQRLDIDCSLSAVEALRSMPGVQSVKRDY